jgi:Immunoglobulin I-set domain/NHL repeat
MFFIKGFTKFVLAVIGGILFITVGGRVRAAQVNAGTSVVLSATADGTVPFSYQWLKDGSKISGATAEKLLFSNVQNSDAGSYAVVVSNSAGSVTAPSVVLSVQAAVIADPVTPSSAGPSNPPSINTQSSAQNATNGHNVTFTAVGGGGTGQWQVSSDGGNSWSNLTNGGHYSGATTATLSVLDVNSTLNDAKYRFVTSAGASNAVSLSVATAFFPHPVGITADGSGSLYVTDSSTDSIQKISTAGVVTLLAGSNGQAGAVDASGADARFNDPSGVTSSSDGSLSVADSANGTLRRISTTGAVSTLAGSTSGRGNADGSGSAATFSSPLGVAQDGLGNLYVADSLNNTIRKITVSGVVSTLAGSAGGGGSADGTGTNARFNHPTGVAVDSSGNVYVADTLNNTIRKVSASGVVTTVAGLTGVSGFQDGVGNGALFNNPSGLAVDLSGNLYLADSGNSVIRKIGPGGVVSTLAGLPGIAGLMDGVGSEAWFNQPKSLVFNSSGTLYVADTGNAAIRKITLTGVVTTLSLSAGAVANTTPPNVPTASVESTVPASSASAVSSTTSGGGGGGGGGAAGGWFVTGLSLTLFLRWCVGRYRHPRSEQCRK